MENKQLFEVLMYVIGVLVSVQILITSWVSTQLIQLMSTIDDGLKTDVDRIFTIVSQLSSDVSEIDRNIQSLRKRMDDVEQE